jgi:hypothetical protein
MKHNLEEVVTDPKMAAAWLLKLPLSFYAPQFMTRRFGIN